MLRILERAEAIYNRIKAGNYTVEFYFYLARELEDLLTKLKSGVYND